MTGDSALDRAGSSRFRSERLETILALARRTGRVDVGDLSARFQVTTETVRKDLSKLESLGVVRRVHGGAVPVERLNAVPELWEREASCEAEKRAIARRALQEVPTGGAVLLDSGTTTAQLAELFPNNPELTVLSNAIPITQTLLERPSLTVFHVGGRVRRLTQSTVDAWALHALAEVSVDVAFLGAYGLSVGRGLTTPDAAEGAVKRAMISAARRVVVLADHTKLGAEHFALVAPVKGIDLLITDSGAPPSAVAALTQAGVEVAIAPPDPNDHYDAERPARSSTDTPVPRKGAD